MTFQSHIEGAYLAAIGEFPDSNPFLPGFIREYILSNVLGHTLNPSKKGVDAWDSENDGVEYKTFKYGKWGRFNVEIQHGFEKHLKDVSCWYFAEFESPFKISRVWSVEINTIREYCKAFMSRTSKTVGHIMIDFRVKWIQKNGLPVDFQNEKIDSEFIHNLRSAQRVADVQYGVSDITLKGRIREIMMAEILDHSIIVNSKKADARDKNGNEYEYLTSLQGNFQMTHMTEENSENKVLRNKAIHCAQFENPVTISEIWEISTQVYLEKMKKRRPWPTDRQNNFTVTLGWVKDNGKCIYQNEYSSFDDTERS